MSRKRARRSDGRETVQHGKGRKRRQDWHAGRAQADAWDVHGHRIVTLLDRLEVGGEPTAGLPAPIRSKGRNNRGDAI